jgi:BirA family biotin operon repressor/biotin-[acetyl-CoA-carboxylase] ligase
MTDAPAEAIEAIRTDLRPELDSTNLEAHRLWREGARQARWIRAERQTQGRGRHGRRWVSEQGNLYATLLWPAHAGLALAGQVSFVAALAMRDTVLALLPAGPRPSPAVKVKWPNDVLLGGAKVSGILTETIGTEADGRTWLAIGCGLNVASAPEDTPYPATCLARHGGKADAAAAGDALARAMAVRLAQWEGRGFREIRADWLEAAHDLGVELTVRVGAEEIKGRFAGLGDEGALLLAQSGSGIRRLHAGEVSVASVQTRRSA